MIKKRFLASLIPAMILVGACGNTDTTDKVQCSVDNDCSDNSGKKFKCSDHRCVMQSADGSDMTCSSASDCGDSSKYECKNSKCLKKESTNDKKDEDAIPCSTNDECPNGGECINMWCTTSSGSNNPGTVNPGPSNRPCSLDIDCTNGDVCVNHYCAKKSGDNEDNNNQNTERTCFITADCPSGYKCVDKVCKNDAGGTVPVNPEDPVISGYCGDRQINTDLNEVCDTSNLNGMTCKTLGKGYYAGALACAKNCLEFDESKCEECDPMDVTRGCTDGKICKDRHCVVNTCGNGTKDENEICDGDDLGGKTCADLNGFEKGSLGCSSTCYFDTSNCELKTSAGDKKCNDASDCTSGQQCIGGVCKFAAMECDPTDLVNSPCKDGKVCVAGKCQAPTCGDGVKNQDSEECDGKDMGGKRCSDYSFESGKLSCSSNCKIETTNCSSEPGPEEPETPDDGKCKADSDCASSEICNAEGACVAKPASMKLDHVVIQELYTGGATSGAKYQSKYVQIFNATGSEIDLKGWSIQYGTASAKFSNNVCTISDDKKLANNSVFLIELSKDADKGDEALPAADYSCVDANSAIKASADAGIIVLTKNAEAIVSEADLTPLRYVDAIGYGSALWGEGKTPAPKASNKKALARKGSGCLDTDNNGTDFEAVDPNPTSGAVSVSCK